MATNLKYPFVSALFVSAFLCISLSFPAHAQLAPAQLQQSSTSPSTLAKPRLVEKLDESKRVALPGNVHPLATPAHDMGLAPDDLALNRMILVLQRSPEQEQALAQLMDAQQTSGSGSYKQWLTPAQFGAQFGVANEDIQTVGNWLGSHGMRVSRVSASHMFIEFSATAGQVREAFHTELHKFHVNGEDRWANVSDPQIPAAIAPVIAGIHSLNSFPARPLHHVAGAYHRSKNTSKIQPAEPQFTYNCGFDPNTDENISCYGVTPFDFATIYNVAPLWNAATPIDGTGQTIAIVAETNINLQDVTQFRAMFGLPPGVVNVILDGPDPGLVPGDETESDLDVEWSGAVAKNATIDLVVTQSTETTLGVDLSALYAVDNNLAPVMSESYGVCELFMGAAQNQFYNAVWQQAAAEGITAFVASGDAGSAVCDRFEGTTPQPAVDGEQVSGFASTPYNVAVGGTDFSEAFDGQLFWSATNNPTTLQSALGYIPETTWNDSCTNAIFAQVGFSASMETNCNNSQLAGYVAAIGGSGGRSNCTAPTGITPANCAGGYAKPVWQSGVGVPADGKRDVPDVSLFASDGFQGSSYIICELDQVGQQPCADEFLAIGGTSASSPAFAGILALVNQQTNSRQGNANYVLYALAAQQTPANCNSSGTVAATCVFNDITSGTNATPCAAGTTNCNVSTQGDAIGILSGYFSTPGFDLTTGLGSVNAFNLVTNWSSVKRTASATTLTLNGGSAVNITHGASINAAVSVSPSSPEPTGNVALMATLAGGTASGVATFTLNNGSASGSTNQLPGGNSYTVKAHYAGDTNYGASDSSAVTVTVNPESSKTKLEIVTFNISTGNVTNSNATSIPYAAPYVLRADVTNASGATCLNSASLLVTYGCPTGSVSLLDNGAALGTPISLNSAANAEYLAIQLTGGTHTLTGNYTGDNSYTSSTGTDSVTITPAPTATTLLPNPPIQKVVIGSLSFMSLITKTVNLQTQGASPANSFTVFDGTKQVYSGALGGGVGFNPSSSGSQIGVWEYDMNAAFTISAPTGNHSISVQYNGDQNYQGSTSAPATVDAVFSTTTAVTSSVPSIQYGQNTTLTATVTPSQSAGSPPTGMVSFGYGSVTLGTMPLANNQAVFTTNAIQGGATTVFANYSGDSNYSDSSGQVTETVAQISTVTAVSSSQLTIFPFVNVTFTAQITPASTGPAPPSSSVNFLANGAFIGSAPLVNNQAQLTTEFSNLGTLSIQAMYAGDNNYAMSSSATLTETVVAAPDFTMSAATPAPIMPGQQASSVVTLTAVAGFSGAVTLTCAVNPTYLTDTPGCTMSQSPVTLSATATSGTATLTVTTTAASQAMRFNPHEPRPVTPIRIPTIAAIFAMLAMLLILAASCRIVANRFTTSGVRADWRLLAVSALVLAASLMMHGCGGGGGGGGTHLTNLGTQPFTYMVAVTGTGNGTTKVTFVTVVVQ